MEPKRITVLFATDKLIIGGAEQQLLELVRGMDKDRFRTIVVTLYSGGELERDFRETSGAEIVCLNRKGKYDFSVLVDLVFLLRRRRVDVVQPFLTPATFFVLLAAMIARTPVRVVTERSGLRRETSLGHSLYLRAEDYLTRFATWVIPNSESGKRFLIGRGIRSDRVRVIYNGVNTRRLESDPSEVVRIRQQLGVPCGGAVIGITASLTPAKDHASFLSAAEIISREAPQARFAILGDGRLRPDLEKMASDLHIRDYVTFLGNQVRVGSYVSAFDVACLCSVDLEGCSNAVLEAMFLGRPVVATDVGGNGELINDGDTGLLVPPRDPGALAGAILSYIKEPQRAREMALRAREMAQTRFSLERMVKDYEGLYEESMAQRRAPPREGRG